MKDDIVPMNTEDPILARMSWLVKSKNNPTGIEIDKLMKMSDDEIVDAYDKWSARYKK